MNRDALITGATGLIGGEIAWRLAASGRRVWCLVRAKTIGEARARLSRRFALSGRECDWSRVVAVPGDVTLPLLGLREESVRGLRDACSHVIHCAADTSFAVTNRCAEVNQIGTRNVVGLCETIGSHARLLHMSSAAACTPVNGGVVREEDPTEGVSNDYVRSKRAGEQVVLNAEVDAVVLRPSIVLSHGVDSRRYARSVLWIVPVMHALGVLPLTGDERLDLVSVAFVAESVVRMQDRPLAHRIYHLSAGPEASATVRELLRVANWQGSTGTGVGFEPDMNWTAFGADDSNISRFKAMLAYYLPFLRSNVVYDCTRLGEALGSNLPLCPSAATYLPELMAKFDEYEAFEEALTP